MAKDKVMEVTEEIYKLSDYVKQFGYFAEINNKRFIVRKNIIGEVYNEVGNAVRGIVETAKAVVNNEEQGEGFKNLESNEIHILARAGVIKLNKKQSKEYQKWFKSQHLVNDED
jgi:hypothetical protein